MTKPRLVIVAGMSGTGKSTTAQNISYLYSRNGIVHDWYHEEMRDHPIRWSDGGEFTVGDIKTEEGMRANIADTFDRWKKLVGFMHAKGGEFVMEGCLYQNIIRYFIPGGYPKEKIKSYYNELMGILQSTDLHIIHLYRPDVRLSFQQAFQVRGVRWENIITEGKSDFDYADEMAYQTLAQEIFTTYPGKKLSLDTSENLWDEYLNKIANFLGIRYFPKVYIPVTNNKRYTGHFVYEDDMSVKTVDVIEENGKLFLSPSWFTHIQMSQISENEFELAAFPMVFRYELVGDDVYITVTGNYDWGIVGKTLKRVDKR